MFYQSFSIAGLLTYYYFADFGYGKSLNNSSKHSQKYKIEQQFLAINDGEKDLSSSDDDESESI